MKVVFVALGHRRNMFERVGLRPAQSRQYSCPDHVECFLARTTATGPRLPSAMLQTMAGFVRIAHAMYCRGACQNVTGAMVVARCVYFVADRRGYGRTAEWEWCLNGW